MKKILSRGNRKMHMKNVKNFFFAFTVAVATGITLSDPHKASALTWTIGTSSATGYANNLYPGQSFTPNILEPSGSGAPGSTAWLQSFTFGPNSSGNLYIYSTEYNGTPGGLASGSGLIGVSSPAVNGNYNFGNGGLLLPDVSSTFYAYTNSQFSSSVDVTDSYSGGSLYFANSSSSYFGTLLVYDWNFQASFADARTQAVPWNVEPGSGLALGLPLFIGLRILKKRRALKKSKSEVHEMTS